MFDLALIDFIRDRSFFYGIGGAGGIWEGGGGRKKYWLRRGEGAAQKKLKEKGGSGEILSEKSEMKFSKIVEIFSCFIHEI